MTDFETLTLPSYLAQSDDVRARFDEIKQRPLVLEIDHLNKSFQSPKGPVTALSDISFSVHLNELVSVIGPSRCGKSTLVRILAGLTSPKVAIVMGRARK